MVKKFSNISKLLEMAINRYQFDIVEWTKYCIENKNIKLKTLPRRKPEPLETLRIQDKISKSITIPPIQKIYHSKSDYINWLDKEYMRDQAFYESILKNPGKYNLYLDNDLLNKEIDNSAREYLKTIKKRRINEVLIINDIPDEKWDKIKISKYPKVLLGLMLGASEEDIINNFGLYFINLLKAYFVGGRTAFLSSSGPDFWNELDKCKAELSYFKEEVILPNLEVVKKIKK